MCAGDVVYYQSDVLSSPCATCACFCVVERRKGCINYHVEHLYCYILFSVFWPVYQLFVCQLCVVNICQSVQIVKNNKIKQHIHRVISQSAAMSLWPFAYDIHVMVVIVWCFQLLLLSRAPGHGFLSRRPSPIDQSVSVTQNSTTWLASLLLTADHVPLTFLTPADS